MGEGEAGKCQTRERLLCSCRAAVDRCAAPSCRAAVGRCAVPFLPRRRRSLCPPLLPRLNFSKNMESGIGNR
jgi:hypothetical protein